MNSAVPPVFQITGNVCVAIAALIFLLPLQKLLWDYAHQKEYSNGWESPALFIFIPLWLVLMGAMLCVTASGGFEWLRVLCAVISGGARWLRFFLHPVLLTIAATLALGVVSFVFVALYIRPGFLPRILFFPPIYLLPLITMLLAILSLNPKLDLGVPLPIFRFSWTIFAGLSLIVGLGFVGYQTFRNGGNKLASIAHRFRNPGPSDREILAQIATLDLATDFGDLLSRASRYESREVRDAATARLRSDPKFLERLSAVLQKGYVGDAALEFLHSATLSPEEAIRLAGPARRAMQRFVSDIPAPNYTTKQRTKQLRDWGTEMFDVLRKKFAATDVDFAPLVADFNEKVTASKR